MLKPSCPKNHLKLKYGALRSQKNCFIEAKRDFSTREHAELLTKMVMGLIRLLQQNLIRINSIDIIAAEEEREVNPEGTSRKMYAILYDLLHYTYCIRSK